MTTRLRHRAGNVKLFFFSFCLQLIAKREMRNEMGSNTQRLSKFQVTKAKCIFKCHQYPRELA